MNIPLFFPSLDLLTAWHIKYQVVRQRTWDGYMMKTPEKSNIQGMFPQVPDPNNDLDEDSIKFCFILICNKNFKRCYNFKIYNIINVALVTVI